MIRTKFIFFTMMLVCCLLFSGCIYIAAGTVGAVGGYAVSNDTMEGITERTLSKTWSTSLQVLSILGSVTVEDKKKGVIEAKIDSSSAKVELEEISSEVIRLRVSARKYLLPNIKLAQKIYTKIIEHSK